MRVGLERMLVALAAVRVALQRGSDTPRVEAAHAAAGRAVCRVGGTDVLWWPDALARDPSAVR